MTEYKVMKAITRGDAIKFAYNHIADQDGVAINVTLYDIRSVLKLESDNEDDDTGALATITDGSGITVSAPVDGFYSLTCMFPATATDISPEPLKFDIQFTLTSDATDVTTPIKVSVPMEQDVTKTSP